MNYDTFSLSINAIIDEHLPEKEAEQLKADDVFIQKHFDAAVSAISKVDPDATNMEAAHQAFSDYTEVIRADIQRLFPKAFISQDEADSR